MAPSGGFAGRVGLGQLDSPAHCRRAPVRAFSHAPDAAGDVILPGRHSRLAGIAVSMKEERAARFLIIGLVIGLLLAVPLAGWLVPRFLAPKAIDIHARVPENGGWMPSDLTATVGQPLHLRLTSDDMLHGFAVGQSDQPPVDVQPGEWSEVTLNFDHPGKYTYFCTRWCGPNHWRMRGTIDVSGPVSSQDAQPARQTPPLYVTLGLDIDAPRHAEVIPGRKPSAAQGAKLGLRLPPDYLETGFSQTHSPEDVWKSLRSEPLTEGLSDDQVWDLVAFIWQSNATPEALALGKKLYGENCAACHGESGAGDGVMAAAVKAEFPPMDGNAQSGPANLTDSSRMLAANSAVLQGKILRGGMGTGMPYWGPIFTDKQVWALVDYLWTFQFDLENKP